MSIFSEIKNHKYYLFKENNSQSFQNDHFYYNDLYNSIIFNNIFTDNNINKKEYYNITDKEDKNTLEIFNNNKYRDIFDENSCNSLSLKRQFTDEPIITDSYLTTKTSSIISKDENKNNNYTNKAIKEINDIKESNKKLDIQTSHKEDIYYKKDIN